MLPNVLFEEKKEYPQYTPSDSEMKKVGFVERRFEEMSAARTVVDRDRDIYQTMIDAVWVPYKD